MHQYQFLPIDVHKDSKNERFIYISIPFDSQRITSRLFLTKNRYCSRVTHHKTQTRPRRNKTLIPRRTTSCLHHAPSKQITFYSARISAEYSISNPLEQPLRRSLRDSIIARWVHPGFIRDTRFLIALLNVNDGRWSNRSAGQWMKNFLATNWHCY